MAQVVTAICVGLQEYGLLIDVTAVSLGFLVCLPLLLHATYAASSVPAKMLLCLRAVPLRLQRGYTPHRRAAQ